MPKVGPNISPMRVNFCTINRHFRQNKDGAGPGDFCRALQKLIFPKILQKWFLPSGPRTSASLQTAYEMSVEGNGNCSVSFAIKKFERKYFC